MVGYGAYSGGGSGGSVYVTTGILAGPGTITATGGEQYTGGTKSGGGGRVAVYYTTNASFTLGNITAVGGTDASNGTVFTQQNITIAFTASTQTVAESAGTVTSTLQLSATYGSSITVPYTVTGTATGSGTDHNLANGNFTVSSSATTGSISFSLTNDDLVESGETVIITLGTPSYGVLISPSIQTITITDNDTAGITLSSSAASVTEGGITASYTLVLTSQPTSSVIIAITSATSQSTPSPTSLTFTTSTWATPQTVTVTAVDDTAVESSQSDTLSQAVSSSDSLYSGFSLASIAVTITDNDVVSGGPAIVFPSVAERARSSALQSNAARVFAFPSALSVNILVKLANDNDSFTQADSAVYFIGTDGYRHAFSSETVYFSWYTSFDAVKVVSSADLAAVSLGTNVTYKPGIRMMKFQTSPKVYVVDQFGVLRWVASESIASLLYGAHWNTMIDDVSDAFFGNYVFGSDVHSRTDFDPASFTSLETPSDSLMVI